VDGVGAHASLPRRCVVEGVDAARVRLDLEVGQARHWHACLDVVALVLRSTIADAWGAGVSRRTL
jgi:hypothetical protein